MELLGDDRSQSVVIGSLLIFAILVLLFSGYQALAVPNQNEAAEQDHSERVQDQMQDVRSSIHATGATGSSTPATVQLGVQYPSRAVFLNPPPASGTLETEASETVEIRNALALDDGASGYWDGGTNTFTTRPLVYRPSYNFLSNPPTTVYESTILYGEFDETALTRTDQRIVRGNEIALVTLNGEFQESSSGATTVEPRAISPGTRTVAVEPDGGDIEIDVPSDLPADTAEALFDEEPHTASCSGTGSDPCGTLTITLDDSTYDTFKLRIADVGVGSFSDTQEPQYVTAIEGNASTIPDNATQGIVVEVRDEYDAPVSGVSVSANLNGDVGSLRSGSKTTNSDGRATFVYEAPSNSAFSGNGEKVTIEFDPAPTGASTTDVTVFVYDSG